MPLPKLFDRLPYYARVADVAGFLQLLCERGIQPELDRFYAAIADRETAFNPYHGDSDPILEFLGQFFGLRAQGSHYLGIGLNPDWSVEQKRLVILEYANYVGIKGTEAGIVKGLSLWLQWENPRVEFIYPYRERRNWINYGDTLGGSLAGAMERQRLGSGDYWPGVTYQPQWKTIFDERVNLAETIPYSRSGLGPNNCWLQLYPEPANWQEVTSNAIVLHRELWDARAKVSHVCWLELSLPQFWGSDLWLLVTTANRSYALRPYHADTNLEFIFKPQLDGETITGVELISDLIKILVYRDSNPLPLNPDLIYGVRILGTTIDTGVLALGAIVNTNQLNLGFTPLFLQENVTYDLATTASYPTTTISWQFLDGTNYEVNRTAIAYPHFSNRPYLVHIENLDYFAGTEYQIYNSGSTRYTWQDGGGTFTIEDLSANGDYLTFDRWENQVLSLLNTGNDHQLHIQAIFSEFGLQYEGTAPLLNGLIPETAILVGNKVIVAGSQILIVDPAAGSQQMIGDPDPTPVTFGAYQEFDVQSYPHYSPSSLPGAASAEEVATAFDDLMTDWQGAIAGNSIRLLPTFNVMEPFNGAMPGRIQGAGSYQGSLYFILVNVDTNQAALIYRDYINQALPGMEYAAIPLGSFAAPAYTPAVMVEFDNKLFFPSRTSLLYWDGEAINDASAEFNLPVATDINQITAIATDGNSLAVAFDNNPIIYYYPPLGGFASSDLPEVGVTSHFGYFNGLVLQVVSDGDWILKHFQTEIVSAPTSNAEPSIISLEPEQSVALFSNGKNVWEVSTDLVATQITTDDDFDSIELLGAYQGQGTGLATKNGVNYIVYFGA